MTIMLKSARRREEAIFTVDKPFLTVLKSKSGGPLFIGRVKEPEF